MQWFNGRCHPTWWKNYNDEGVNDLKPPKGERPLDWRNDAFAFHFTGRWTPTSLQSPQELLKGDDIYAEMGRMVLAAADMVKRIQ